MRFPTLRQQWERDGQTSFRSLADYIAPRETGIADYLGAFAVTAGLGLESLVERIRTRSRRLQRDHEQGPGRPARRRPCRDAAQDRPAKIGDYGRDERLTIDELIEEKYRGIRPASGYPSSPDHTEKRDLWRLLDVEQTDRDRPDRVLRDVSRLRRSAAFTSRIPRPATSPSTSSPATRSKTTPPASECP